VQKAKNTIIATTIWKLHNYRRPLKVTFWSEELKKKTKFTQQMAMSSYTISGTFIQTGWSV